MTIKQTMPAKPRHSARSIQVGDTVVIPDEAEGYVWKVLEIEGWTESADREDLLKLVRVGRITNGVFKKMRLGAASYGRSKRRLCRRIEI